MKKSNLIIGISSALVLTVAAIMAVILVGNKKDIDKPINEVITYKIKFDSNGGSEIEEQNIKNNEFIKIPNEPTKDGYIFVGWKYNGVSFDFNTKISTDITLTAEWYPVTSGKEVIVVRFDSDGGTTLFNQVIEKNNTITKPNNPVKIGYEFLGWYYNDEAFDFSKKVFNDIELVAKWKVKTPEIPTLSNAIGYSPLNELIKAELNIITEGAYAEENVTASGYEVYEKKDGEYILVDSKIINLGVTVTVDIGESKIYVARTYSINASNEKVYSEYSNEIKIDNSKVITPTLSNAAGHTPLNALKTLELSIIAEGEYGKGDLTATGYEIYEKKSGKYILVGSKEVKSSLTVKVDIGESKTYVARAYSLNQSNEKVYSEYSNEIKIDNSKVITPTLSNAAGYAPSNALMKLQLSIVVEGEYGKGDLTATGYEIYEKKSGKYILVGSKEVKSSLTVTVDIGESKIYVARAYVKNASNEKVYSGYSNELVLDNSKVTTPTLINPYVNQNGYIGFENGKYIYDLGVKFEDYCDFDELGTEECSIAGFEVYEKDGATYKYHSSGALAGAAVVEVEAGTKKTFVARVYVYNKSNEKVYSDYSNALVLDHSKIATPTLRNATLTACGVGCADYVPELVDGKYYYDLAIDKAIYGSIEFAQYSVTGYVIYEKTKTGFIEVESTKMTDTDVVMVTINPGEKKEYVARVYAEDSEGNKHYSDYSNVVTIDHSKLPTPTLTEASGRRDETGVTSVLNVVSEGYYGMGIFPNFGYEVYEKKAGEYILIDSKTIDFGITVTVSLGESKTVVARVYVYNQSNEKVYSGYSNEIVIE